MEIWGGNEGTQTAVSMPGIDAFVYARPYAGESCGGDVHYVSLCSGGKIGRFVVADVAGHGDEAGQTAAELRGLMRRYINTPDQSRFTRALNRAFLGKSAAGRFATALLATYYTPTDRLIICNAGHPRPLHWSARTGLWRALDEHDCAGQDGAVNLPLGIIDPTEYTQFSVALEREDLVLIHTDSILEARDAAGSMLGEQGVLDILGELDAGRADELAGRIMERVRAYSGGHEPDDDVTLLVLRHNAQEPPRYSVMQKARMFARWAGFTGQG